MREYYYVALANCLWADILSDNTSANHLSAAQRVLLLFLDPTSQPDADAQIEAIRSGMNDAVLERIASTVGVSEEFAAWLIGIER